MKHLDIRPLIEAVKNIESQEARKALSAYGGQCTFDPENPPCAEFYGGSGPASSDVKRIRFTPDRSGIVLEVWDDSDDGHGATFEVDAADLYPGSLLSVIEFM